MAVVLAATVPALPPRALRPLIEAPGATALAAYITVVGVFLAPGQIYVAIDRAMRRRS